MMRAKKCVALLDQIAYYIEAAVTFFLLLAVVILLLQTVAEHVGFTISIITAEFNSILSKAFTLIIGVEFTKMLCKHTPETVIEVLLFATARQVIISHENTINTLLGVIAIAALFAVKRYLIPPYNK